jgi:hypothetical protein
MTAEYKLLSIIFVPICLFLAIGTFRTFLRAGLKGELIRTTGIVILIVGGFIDNIPMETIGFILFNIGWIILLSFEADKRREIYKQTTIFERLIGNVPLIKDRKGFPKTYKKETGIIVGVVCLLMSFSLINKIKTFDLVEIVYYGILVFAGIYFVVFSFLKGENEYEG